MSMVQGVRAEKTVESLSGVIPHSPLYRWDSQATMQSDSPDTLFKFPSIPSTDTDAWTWGRDLSFLGPLPVSKLMGNCESQGESRIFIDVTTPVRLAHSRQVGQTQSLTGAIDTSTDVFSESREQRWVGTSGKKKQQPSWEKTGY